MRRSRRNNCSGMPRRPVPAPGAAPGPCCFNPRGLRRALTGGDDTAYLNLSWRQLSSLLVPVLDAYQGTAAHKSPQRHMAEQSAACFIRRMASL